MRPETRDAYGPDWAEVSRSIRFDRAGGRCECDGLCGNLACTPRCVNRHGEPMRNGKIAILTTAHLNHEPADRRDENLRALCAPCHLRYDGPRHAETRRARQADPDGLMLW